MSKTAYDDRYAFKDQYWEFRPSSMAFKILELRPPLKSSLKVLDIGCGEGGTAVFLARNGYQVTAFDLSSVGIEKTLANAQSAGVEVKAFQADVNDYLPTEMFDIIFSSGTVQYLRPERRHMFISAMKQNTNAQGLHVIHAFVAKPFIAIAPDAEESEHLWSPGELLTYYGDWKTEQFIEEIIACNSSGVNHFHAHNRIWSSKP